MVEQFGWMRMRNWIKLNRRRGNGSESRRERQTKLKPEQQACVFNHQL